MSTILRKRERESKRERERDREREVSGKYWRRRRTWVWVGSNRMFTDRMRGGRGSIDVEMYGQSMGNPWCLGID